MGLPAAGGVVPAILIFIAPACCGFQMLRLFFKI